VTSPSGIEIEVAANVEPAPSESALPGDVQGYERIARVYNRHMAEDFIRRALPLTKRLLLARLSPGARLLDACCGTGQMSRALGALGFDVLGFDCCEAMLRLARGNAPRAHFLRADLRHVDLTPQFTAALSTFNSLAHLAGYDELCASFRNIRNALETGGEFMFDATVDEGYRARWHGSFSFSGEDYECTVRPRYDPRQRRAENHITCSVHENGGWQRSDLTLAQKCHDESDLQQALEDSGFSDVRAYDAERDLGLVGEAGWKFFLAQK